MTGDGKHTSHKHVDDLGMVQMALCLPHHIAGNYPPGIKRLHGAGIFTNIYIHLPLKSPGHVGEYTIHGVYMGMF